MPFKKLLVVSRPERWVYTLGAYALGLVAGASESGQVLNLRNFLWALFWLLPANLLLYGLAETGRERSGRNDLWRDIGTYTLPFFPLLFVSGRAAVLTIYVFVITAIVLGPSGRGTKKSPFLVAVSSLVYLLPGLFGYLLAGGGDLLTALFGAATLWAFAIGLFESVPSLSSARKKRWLKTDVSPYAVTILSIILIVAAAELAKPTLGWTVIAAGDLYTVLMVTALFFIAQRRAGPLVRLLPLATVFVVIIILVVVGEHRFGDGDFDFYLTQEIIQR